MPRGGIALSALIVTHVAALPTGEVISWRCSEEVQAASRRDDGCLHYGYYSEISDPLSFIAVEEWRDRGRAALRTCASRTSPA